MAAPQHQPARTRLLFLGAMLPLAVWHSLGSSHLNNWKFGELTRDLKALINSLDDDEHSLDVSLINEGNPVLCHNRTSCCGIWNVDADSWWIHHPQWEVVSENKDIFCFSPMQDTEKRLFLEQLHWTQWQVNVSSTEAQTIQTLQAPIPKGYNYTVNCSDMRASVNINSGYGATIAFLLQSFWEAHTQQKPFQTIQQWPWLYANDDANSTWINCTVHDQSCFYLPISPCSRENTNQERYQARPNTTNSTQMKQWLWVEEYLTRPNQKTRQEMQRLRQPLEDQLQSGTLCMHVRRGDAGTPQPPFRRYASVQEYLDLVNPEPNTTIFLMSDDASTVDEVQKYHSSKFNWVYTDKIRVRGVERGFNNHIPEGSSGPDELAYITLEQGLAATYCDAFVFGNSGYAQTLLEKMKLKGNEVRQYVLETRISSNEVTEFSGKPKEREAHLMKQVNAIYDK